MGLYSINRRASVIGGTGFGGRQQAPLIARGQMFAGYDIPPQEVAELYKLFTQTGGQNWINHTNWFANKTCATWYGLTVVGGRVTKIELQNNNLAGVTSFNPKPFVALTHLYATSNTTLSMRFGLADLPAMMLWLYLDSTQSVITGALSDLPVTVLRLYLNSTQSLIAGSLADLPAALTRLYLNSTQSLITGALADLPSTMQYLILNSTQSLITGGASAMAANGILSVHVQDTATDQAGIDSICTRLHTDRALFTAAAPILNIGGTNPDPTGVYRAANPPTTPLEMVYTLVNDNLAEGFKKWAITY